MSIHLIWRRRKIKKCQPNIYKPGVLVRYTWSPEPIKSKLMEKVDSYYSITMNQFLNQSLLNLQQYHIHIHCPLLSPFIHIIIYRYFQVPSLNSQTIDQLSISLCFQRRNCLRESGNGVGHSCTRRRRGHPCHTSRRATRAMWSSDATLPKDRRRCSQSPKVSPRRCRTCGT